MITSLLRALRAFFGAGHSDALRHGWEDLRRILGEKSDNSSQINWQEMEYAFTRLFIGPDLTPALPYASVWTPWYSYINDIEDASFPTILQRRQGKPLLMTDITLDMRRLYHRLGYAVPHEGRLPDDHLVFELDALLIGLAALPKSSLDAPWRGDSRVVEAVIFQLAEHMASWVPRFCARALAESDVPQPLRWTLNVLEYAVRKVVALTRVSHETVLAGVGAVNIAQQEAVGGFCRSDSRRYGHKLGEARYHTLLEAAPVLSEVEPMPSLVAYTQLPGSVIHPCRTFHCGCPHCGDTCGLKVLARNGIIQSVQGAAEYAFTRGGLCAKGPHILADVYSPGRIKYPMVQDGRATGRWRRITWHDALERIACKILDLRKRDGSLLGLGLFRHMDEFNMCRPAVDTMMASLGYITHFQPLQEENAAQTAQRYDLGDIRCNDLEEIKFSRCIVVWGGDPFTRSPYARLHLKEAQRQGAVLISVDSVFTQTAAQSTLFCQIRPGGEGALALGMARHIIDAGLEDADFVRNHCLGFELFADYLRREIPLDWASAESGVPEASIRHVAEIYALAHPGSLWIGLNMQQEKLSFSAMRAIDALAALTGNIGIKGGGVSVFSSIKQTSGEELVQLPVVASGNSWEGCLVAGKSRDRVADSKRLGRVLLELNNPPIRMLWLNRADPLSQALLRERMQRAFMSLEMVVAVDHTFTDSLNFADIILPATAPFEEWAVRSSPRHYWINICEQIIQPLHESKSDEEIAALLFQHINRLQPDALVFSGHPELGGQERKLAESLLGGKTRKSPAFGAAIKRKPFQEAPWEDYCFATPSGKYEFYSERCAADGYDALPVYNGKA